MSEETHIKHQPFSWRWVLLSVIIFIGLELLLGGLVGDLVAGQYKSLHLQFVLQGLLNLAGYFLGGFFIGLVSPKVRILEPAVGAFVSVALMLSLTFLTPYKFLQFSTGKLIIGGLIAVALALTGAKLGEKITGQI